MEPPAKPLIERRAVRALLLTPEREVLLIRVRPPEGLAPFWIAPGGGLMDGESEEDGLRRELVEELGLTGFKVGALLWRRYHTFDWLDRRISQREVYRAVHVERFDPVMSDADEAQWVGRMHWWPIGDLRGAGERLTPLALADILDRYLHEGPPAGVLEEEVLVD